MGRRVEYVVAMEFHKTGWPHFHPLLDVGELQEGDIQRVGGLWFRQNGYARLERPRNSQRVAAYAAKYLFKDIASGDVVLSDGLNRVDGYKTGLWPDRRR